MGGDDDELFELDDDELGSGEEREGHALKNLFGVSEFEDQIVMARRPGARLTHDEALNLAAWIVAEVGCDVGDFEELVRLAVEGEC